MIAHLDGTPADRGLLAFDARLTGVPPALLEELWQAIDGLPNSSDRTARPASVSVATALYQWPCRVWWFGMSWRSYPTLRVELL
jgi:hypothetical protein